MEEGCDRNSLVLNLLLVSKPCWFTGVCDRGLTHPPCMAYPPHNTSQTDDGPTARQLKFGPLTLTINRSQHQLKYWWNPADHHRHNTAMNMCKSRINDKIKINSSLSFTALNLSTVTSCSLSTSTTTQQQQQTVYCCLYSKSNQNQIKNMFVKRRTSQANQRRSTNNYHANRFIVKTNKPGLGNTA